MGDISAPRGSISRETAGAGERRARRRGKSASAMTLGVDAVASARRA